MQILIPVGGSGSRLWPLTAFRPKPLLPLGERPILEHLLDRLPSHLPVTLIVSRGLVAPFHGWMRAQDRPNVRVYVEPAGSANGSGIPLALRSCILDLNLDEDIAVLVGDSVQPLPTRAWDPVVHLQLGTFAVDSLDEARNFGVVAGRDGWVTQIEEKPRQPRSCQVFTGAAIVPRRLLSRLCDLCEGAAGDLGSVLGELLRRGEPAVPFAVPAPWRDLGTLPGYFAAHEALSASMSAAGRRYRRAGGTYVHPGAIVENSDLSGSLVLAPATLLDCNLSRCIVLSPERVQRGTFESTLLCDDQRISLSQARKATCNESS